MSNNSLNKILAVVIFLSVLISGMVLTIMRLSIPEIMLPLFGFAAGIIAFALGSTNGKPPIPPSGNFGRTP